MPYPDYSTIPEHQRRKRMEMEVGRQHTLKTIAESWAVRVREDYRVGWVEVDHSDPDPRKWEMVISMEKGGEVSIRENFFDFPSDEFVAKAMLLGLMT